MTSWLLDTNIVSEATRPTPHPGVLARLSDPASTFCIASFTWHELLFGLARLPHSVRRRQLELYLHEVVAATMTVLSYDTSAADLHGSERARLASTGRTMSFIDGGIAAIAVTHDLPLVTRNESDFDGFAGVRIENWFRR